MAGLRSLGGFYIIGFATLFAGVILRFRDHRAMPRYLHRCWAAAKDHAAPIAAFAFAVYPVALVLILFPSAVIFAVLNAVFFAWKASDALFLGWVLAVASLAVVVALAYSYRETMRDVDEDRYFAAQADRR